MRKTIFVLSAVGSLLIYSCSKNDHKTQLDNPNLAPAMVLGEDDHRPVIIVKVVDAENHLLPGCFITVYSTTDTFTGNTDTNGICTLILSDFGTWSINVIHNGYTPINSSLNIVDSATNVNETMLN